MAVSGSGGDIADLDHLIVSLPGEWAGTLRDVIIVATEDSWDHTIVPRLMAAGADLERVHRVEAVTPDGLEASGRSAVADDIVMRVLRSAGDGTLG